ncbi:hypothetical protein GQ457_11G017820 [Hibiscus cannabinus]
MQLTMMIAVKSRNELQTPLLLFLLSVLSDVFPVLSLLCFVALIYMIKLANCLVGTWNLDGSNGSIRLSNIAEPCSYSSYRCIVVFDCGYSPLIRSGSINYFTGFAGVLEIL